MQKDCICNRKMILYKMCVWFNYTDCNPSHKKVDKQLKGDQLSTFCGGGEAR